MRISDWSSDVCSSDLAQCGGAKTAVQVGVAFITYANPAGVKQANNRRDSLLPTDTRLLQVPLHARPQLGQRAAEPSAPVELVRFLPGAELGMIAILFTALLVIPDRLALVRKSVVLGKVLAVSLDLGGCAIIKK